jgi:hypothetical protein
VSVSTATEAARAEPRLKVFQLASLRTGGAPHRAHVLDISRSGARVHCTAGLQRGQRVMLAIDPLDIAATVLWETGARAGLRFDAPLTDDQLQRVAALP